MSETISCQLSWNSFFPVQDELFLHLGSDEIHKNHVVLLSLAMLYWVVSFASQRTSRVEILARIEFRGRLKTLFSWEFNFAVWALWKLSRDFNFADNQILYFFILTVSQKFDFFSFFFFSELQETED